MGIFLLESRVAGAVQHAIISTWHRVSRYNWSGSFLFYCSIVFSITMVGALNSGYYYVSETIRERALKGLDATQTTADWWAWLSGSFMPSVLQVPSGLASLHTNNTYAAQIPVRWPAEDRPRAADRISKYA